MIDGSVLETYDKLGVFYDKFSALEKTRAIVDGRFAKYFMK